MPATPRASALVLMGVAAVFLGGIGFGAVAALTQPRKEVAKASTPETTPEPEPTPATAPAPAATTKKAEPTRRAEPKPEPPEKPDAKPTAKTESKKPDPKPAPPKAEPVSYEKQVLPIFKTKCLTCHGDPQVKGGIDLRTLAKAVEGGDTGPGATPGKPDDSQIWVRLLDTGAPMPPPGSGKEKLTPAELKLVKDWILSGAK